MWKIVTAVILVFLVQIAAQADAASMSVVPGGTGVFYLKGYNFVNIGGVEVEILYDTATLANPRITQGPLLASSMFIPNPNCSPPACSRPNAVKIAAMSLSGLSGSGDIATITFDLKGSTAGPVAIGRSKLVDAAAQTVKQETPPPVETADTTGTGGTASGGAGSGGTDSTGTGSAGTGVTATGTTSTGTTSTGYAGTSSGGITGLAVSGAAAGSVSSGDVSVSGSASAGTISLPQDQIAAAEAARKSDYQPLVTDLRKDMTESGGEKSSAGEQRAEPPKKEQQKFISYKSTLQLFREFKGEKSSNRLIPLFAEISTPDFTQEPAIAFADGKTPLKVTLTLKQSSSDAPRFLLEGANVKQIGGEGEGAVTWTIEAVPKKDAVEAVLTVVDGQNVMEFPLTVVPMINPLLGKGTALSEADFTAYLAKPPKFDFNNDQKFDAVDDYIYTANYIVAMKIKPVKAAKEETTETPKAEKKVDGTSKTPAQLKDEKKKAPEKPPVKP